jgi:hypothetical protein
MPGNPFLSVRFSLFWPIQICLYPEFLTFPNGVYTSAGHRYSDGSNVIFHQEERGHES